MAILRNVTKREFMDFESDANVISASGTLTVPLAKDKKIRYIVLKIKDQAGDYQVFSASLELTLEINGKYTIFNTSADLLLDETEYIFGTTGELTGFNKFLLLKFENDPINHEGILDTGKMSSINLILANNSGGDYYLELYSVSLTDVVES